MIKDFEAEAAVDAPVPPTTVVERSPGHVPVTAEATAPVPQEVHLAIPHVAQ